MMRIFFCILFSFCLFACQRKPEIPADAVFGVRVSNRTSQKLLFAVAINDLSEERITLNPHESLLFYKHVSASSRLDQTDAIEASISAPDGSRMSSRSCETDIMAVFATSGAVTAQSSGATAGWFMLSEAARRDGALKPRLVAGLRRVSATVLNLP